MSDERRGERQEQEGPARPGDRSEHLADAVLEVDLAEQARELREEETWRSAGHGARTLVKNDSLRMVLVDLLAGARVGEHRTGARISIQVLTGRVRILIPGRELELAAGHLVALDEWIQHDVEALEPSSFLLTLACEGEAEALVH